MGGFLVVDLEREALHAVVADPERFFGHRRGLGGQPGKIILLETARLNFQIAVPAAAFRKHVAQSSTVAAALHRAAKQRRIQKAAAQRRFAKGAHARFASVHDIGKIQRGTADVHHQRAFVEHIHIQRDSAGVLGIEKRRPRF